MSFRRTSVEQSPPSRCLLATLHPFSYHTNTAYLFKAAKAAGVRGFVTTRFPSHPLFPMRLTPATEIVSEPNPSELPLPPPPSTKDEEVEVELALGRFGLLEL